jgi:hypothetical protein
MPRRLVPPLLTGVPRVAIRAEVAAAGVSDRRIARLVAEGLWLEPATSVFVRSPVAGGRDLQQVAARLLGSRHAVTGLSGLRALGVPRVPTGPDVHVLVDHSCQRLAVPPLHFLRTTRLPAQTWSGGDGIRIAPAERCAVDAARLAADLRSARAVVCAAACWGVDVPSLVEELADVPRRGSAIVRRAVGDVVAGARSAPEAELGDVLCEAVVARRLPPFLLNPDLHVDGVFVGTPDAWIVGAGVGVQVDSREFHSEDDDFDRTLARHDTYTAAGLSLLHVTPRRLRRLRAAYSDIVVDAVVARQRSGATESVGLTVTPKGPLLPIRRRSR